VRLSLDTHVLLWAVTDDDRLPPEVGEAILDPANEVLVSAACIWEVAIKAGLGRLPVDVDALVEAVPASGFQPLPVTAAHAAGVAALEPSHRDPFDRLLVAQARQEDLVLATVDAQVRQYAHVDVLPAR
jgi:PIN domain nuclease of toxin-antitoxin system